MIKLKAVSAILTKHYPRKLAGSNWLLMLNVGTKTAFSVILRNLHRVAASIVSYRCQLYNQPNTLDAAFIASIPPFIFSDFKGTALYR